MGNDAIEVLDPEVVVAELAEVERRAEVTEDTALALRGQFASYYGQIVEWREKVTMITNPDDPVQQTAAREIRLGLKSVRCNVESLRKALKADSLARGKAIDGFANVLKYLCEPIEEKLLAVEQIVERREAERIAALVAERVAALVAVECDPSAYNLCVMDEDTFRLVLEGAKMRREERIEAVRKADADRVAREKADAEERARVKADNERLKAEAEAREKQMQAERDATAKRQREVEAKAAKERAEERAKAEAKLKAEREAREKLEHEAAEARRKEEARVAAEKAAAARAARAPDREKLATLAGKIREVTLPVMDSDAGRTIMINVRLNLNHIAATIDQQTAAL